jgi:hypothetical protein
MRPDNAADCFRPGRRPLPARPPKHAGREVQNLLLRPDVHCRNDVRGEPHSSALSTLRCASPPRPAVLRLRQHGERPAVMRPTRYRAAASALPEPCSGRSPLVCAVNTAVCVAALAPCSACLGRGEQAVHYPHDVRGGATLVSVDNAAVCIVGGRRPLPHGREREPTGRGPVLWRREGMRSSAA